MKAKEFDKQFDAGESILQHLEINHAARPGQDQSVISPDPGPRLNWHSLVPSPDQADVIQIEQPRLRQINRKDHHLAQLVQFQSSR